MPVLTPDKALERFNVLAKTIEEMNKSEISKEEAFLLITEGNLANTFNQSIIDLIQSGASKEILDEAEKRIQEILKIVNDALYVQPSIDVINPIENNDDNIPEIDPTEVDKLYQRMEAAENEGLSHFTAARSYQILIKIQESEAKAGQKNMQLFKAEERGYYTNEEQRKLLMIDDMCKKNPRQASAYQAEFRREYTIIQAKRQTRQTKFEAETKDLLTEDLNIWKALMTIKTETKEGSVKGNYADTAIAYLENPTDSKIKQHYILAQTNLQRESPGLISSHLKKDGAVKSKTVRLKALEKRITNNANERDKKTLNPHLERVYVDKLTESIQAERKKMEAVQKNPEDQPSKIDYNPQGIQKENPSSNKTRKTP